MMKLRFKAIWILNKGGNSSVLEEYKLSSGAFLLQIFSEIPQEASLGHVREPRNAARGAQKGEDSGFRAASKLIQKISASSSTDDVTN